MLVVDEYIAVLAPEFMHLSAKPGGTRPCVCCIRPHSGQIHQVTERLLASIHHLSEGVI